MVILVIEFNVSVKNSDILEMIKLKKLGEKWGKKVILILLF